MSVATRVQPNFPGAVDNTQYMAEIDAASAVDGQIGGAFAPHEAAVPDMTVVVDAGRLQSGVALVELAQQAAGAIIAPVTDPRNDIVVVDNTTGVVSVVAGVEAVSPVDPVITAGKIPVARVRLATSMTVITNSIIDDLRPLISAPVRYEAGTFSPELWDPSNSGAEGQTYAVQEGSYTRHGNRVFVSVDLTMSGLGTLSAISEARIGNLPFVPEFSGRDSAYSGYSANLGLAVAGGNVVGTFVSSGGGGYLALNEWASISGTSLLRIFQITSSGVLKLSGNYSVAL